LEFDALPYCMMKALGVGHMEIAGLGLVHHLERVTLANAFQFDHSETEHVIPREGCRDDICTELDRCWVG